MDNNENSKVPEPPLKSPNRRPLPTPGSITIQPPPRPNTPPVAEEPLASTSFVPSSPQRPTSPVKQNASVASSSAISTSNFYSSQPPALPSRPKNVGSSHTTVWAPTDTFWPAPDPLPSYAASISSSGYREPELVVDTEDDSMPDLISSEQISRNEWGTGSGWGGSDWSTNAWSRDLVKVDGRDRVEEEHWWDSARHKVNRPGPGMLPPLLADTLHNPEHTLFSVTFTAPEIQPSATSQSSQSSSGSTSAALPPEPPSFDEVRASRPHPDAYYCPKDNGWVIMTWGYSDNLPPLARSFQTSSHRPLPRPIRRNPENCSDSTANETHHFHKYEKAVDGHQLDVPFRFDQWDTIETVKSKRRVGTVLPDELDLEKLSAEDDDKMEVDDQEGPPLDLYVCCQCTFYLLRSPVIPGVVPRPLWDDFLKEKNDSPQLGKTPIRSTALAMETLLMAIENILWKGETRMLRVTRPGFQNKIGWSPVIQKVFETLGFSGDTFDTESGMRPPIIDINSPQGRQNRAKLLRAWAEIGSWTSDFERVHPSLLQHDHKGYKLWVTLENVREKYQLAIGAHPTQIPRGELHSPRMLGLEALYKEWRSLGMTQITFSPELLIFAYLAQCRCDPGQTLEYFSNLRTLARALDASGNDCVMLVQLLDTEGSRGRFAREDIDAAAATLGFGVNGYLQTEYDAEVPDDYVENAWRECLKRSWHDYANGTTLQKRATDALKIIADARGSHTLQKVHEDGGTMTPERAFGTLEVPQDVDEEMLIAIFGMRLEEDPKHIDKMKAAMRVIAEFRDSTRLRKLLELGHDTGPIVGPTRADLPRGLNQLGNTCYLNSLLQYFYTIKELRAAVRPMDGLDKKSIEDDKLTDDDLKRHRVGGRLVTRREIIRSKKFISRLANLFHELEYCEAAAVTPHLELAKLALVTSKDEEEDEDKGGTDSSNDTDATLVDDGPARITASDQPPVSSPTRDDRMDLDKENVPVRSTSPLGSGEASSSKISADPSADSTAKRPPQLPPRKATEVSDSTMMFGKQHDVAECMDNCMFQIETALLKFDAMSGSQDDNKTSVVKRLFYGKIRQRIASDDPQSRSSVHEKEDLFSHLPVNVADDGVDIYDGLSGYFDDVVEFQGKKARMEVTLLETPPLLQIQLQRVQFNRDTLQPYKSQAYVKFGETIYMDRFLDSADPQKKARGKIIQAELTKCRDRIRTLLTSKSGPCATILKNTHLFMSAQDDVDEELITHLHTEQEHIDHEIDLLRVRIDELKDTLEDLWRDCTDAPYELTSVFIHRGSSPSWGHYFFYSRDLPNHPDSWFKYNDSDVTVIDKGEVLADTTGSTANPYLLVFARKGSEVVETVNRKDVANLPSS
ncbi:hypothetical protein DFH07DRAFT_496988 [Mycena maculata]|uniref:ubiquitinyl hydrolase 1 n=1 Tax=Mycena maculata TaxID=230809 RepID=A0AAD7J1F3_9AGAR|nr:hypothetical protein DFH07DRAFT_496988 [Mycena maculata]